MTPIDGVPAQDQGRGLRLLLVGPRRMQNLAGRLREVAPKAEFMVVPSAAEGEPYLPDVDAVVIADRVRPAYVRAPRLRWMHLYPTGVDHVTIPALRDAPFTITYKVRASVIPMAEHLMALLLAIVRRLPDYRDLQVRREWRHHSTRPTTELRQLNGATLGIVGLGNTGLEIARRAAAFNMRVLGLKRTIVPPPPGVEAVLPPDRLHDLLAASDFVAVLATLNDHTFHLIGEPELRAMKPTAHLLNISRGPVVDQRALERALRSGQIAGAALDVFEQEPLDPSSPLWELPNVIITPHAAGSGPDNERDAADNIADNLRRFIAGQPLVGQLNRADIITTFEAPTH